MDSTCLGIIITAIVCSVLEIALNIWAIQYFGAGTTYATFAVTTAISLILIRRFGRTYVRPIAYECRVFEVHRSYKDRRLPAYRERDAIVWTLYGCVVLSLIPGFVSDAIALFLLNRARQAQLLPIEWTAEELEYLNLIAKSGGERTQESRRILARLALISLPFVEFGIMTYATSILGARAFWWLTAPGALGLLVPLYHWKYLKADLDFPYYAGKRMSSRHKRGRKSREMRPDLLEVTASNLSGFFGCVLLLLIPGVLTDAVALYWMYFLIRKRRKFPLYLT
jgi:UPF0716 family protein affecting phage T7 exclusion